MHSKGCCPVPDPQSSREFDTAPAGMNGAPYGYRSASINEQQMLGRGGSRGVRALVVVLGVAVVAALVAVVAWRMHSSPSPPSPLAAAPSGADVSATSHPASIGAMLESVALQQSDLGPGYRMHLVGHGDKVTGQTTLDNCGYRFTTEAHRVARREYEIVDAASHFAGAGNEVVAYDTPADAALAVSQWHQSMLTCPHHPVVAASAGGHRVRERVMSVQVDSQALPVADNIISVDSVTTRKLGTMYMIVALQVRGNVLDAVFGVQRRVPTDDDVRGLLLIATATGVHLSSAA
jgi:hypothetical protein